MRKICVVVASRANYGRVKPVLAAIHNHPELELQLVVSASMLLERYGKAIEVVEADGFPIAKRIYYVLEGGELITQAKSTGLGIIELSTAFEELRPDVVITVADRFETMATAIAASYLNIPLAHIQGGEITGNIDEIVRHAITKLSQYHFPATEQSKQRLLRMGEEEWRVINTGCPSIDTLAQQDLSLQQCEEYVATGSGVKIDIFKPYIMVVQHPVTSEVDNAYQQVMETLEAMNRLDCQKIVLWPNIDAGTDKVSKAIRVFKGKNKNAPFRFIKNFPPEIYNCLMANAICLVGNSSSFIREGSWLGTPAVIVGNRQMGREHGSNVVFSKYDKLDIYNKVCQQIEHGKYESESIFGSGRAGLMIADYLATVNLDINKRMTY